MLKQILLSGLAAVFLMMGAGSAAADCMPMPDAFLSTAWIFSTDATIFASPAGSGPLLSQAQGPNGATVDARIWVQVLDPMGNPMVGFDPTDIWIESSSGSVYSCLPAHPSTPTDINGITSFDVALNWGGYHDPDLGDQLIIKICNQYLMIPNLPLRVVTSDLNGDGDVDLSDVISFASFFLSGLYHPSIDYYHDGTINLSDLVRFSSSTNQLCPPGF